MKLKTYFFLSILLVVHPTLRAIDSRNLADTLQEVVVSDAASRTIRIGMPLARTFITRSEIEASGEASILSLLNGRIPGLFVTERGMVGFGVSTGAAGQISMRGVGGSPTTGVLVIMDGNPQYMGLFGHPLADIYSSSGVESVEVIRGPVSLYTGTNAMGGVINIQTRRTKKEGFSGEAGMRFGSFQTKEFVATGSYKHKGLNLLTTFNRNSTDGHRPNSGFDQNSEYLKLGYLLNDHFRFHADLNLSRFHATDPGPDTLGAVHGQSMDILRGSWSAAVSHQFDRFYGSVRLFRSFGKHDITDGFHSEDYNNGLIISETIHPFNYNLTTIGLSGNRYGGVAEQRLAHARLVDTSVVELGAFVNIQQNLTDRLTLIAGMRLQHHSRYGREWIPAAGISWDLKHGMTWKASFGKGFRSPTLRELFMFNHNPELDPERVWNWETSFLKEFEEYKATLELTAFYLYGENLIVTGPMGRLYNGGSISNKGLEVAAGCNPSEQLRLQLTFSHLEMATPVFATPRNHLFVQGTYRFGKLRLNTGLRCVDRLNSAVNGVHFQSYALLNAGVLYNLLPNLELNLSGNNLLDQHYETIRYYTMPGINGSAGLNYRF